MLDRLTVSAAADQIRRGLLDPRELLESCLAAIQQYESRVHAWVQVDAHGARIAAEQLRQRVLRGEELGPLAGIPVGVKDITDVAGLPTAAGSPLRGQTVAAADAPMVTALRQAGAIILGKTVTVEFACFDPPPTRNPWHRDLQHTPGGSSSGSAVAVCLGMCLGATGSQTGGSLVRPASYCGIAAWKPGFGRIRLDRFVPVAHHLDHAGLLARTVADLQRFAAPFAHPHGAVAPSGPRGSRHRHRSAPQLGFVQEFFLAESDRSVRTATLAALEQLRQAGATIHPALLPGGFAEVHRMHRRIMAAEAAAYHRADFRANPGAFGAKISALLEEGLAVSATEYEEALAHQRRFRLAAHEAARAWDALILPATNTTAPPSLETTGDPRFQSPWTYAGLPVLSLPCGLADDGLPAAIQLVRARGAEQPLFDVGLWCEERLDFHFRPPLIEA